MRALLEKGTLREPRLILTPALVARFSRIGKNSEERGVVQLVEKRKGEKTEMHVYLFAETDSSLRIVGLQTDV